VRGALVRVRVTHCLHTLIGEGILIGYHMTSNGRHGCREMDREEVKERREGRREGVFVRNNLYIYAVHVLYVHFRKIS
jgi:hypothetical protein